VEHGEQGSHLTLAPQQMRSIVDRFSQSIPISESTIAVITSSGSRYFLKQLTENSLPAVAVIAHNEVASGIRVICLGTIK
jgi:type III secretory pathway component EscV